MPKITRLTLGKLFLAEASSGHQIPLLSEAKKLAFLPLLGGGANFHVSCLSGRRTTRWSLGDCHQGAWLAAAPGSLDGGLPCSAGDLIYHT